MKRYAAVIAPLAGLLFAMVFPAGTDARQGRGAVQLADGPGRDLVQATCAKCHGLNNITNSSGNTKDGWETLISTMVALPADERNTITTYLAAHYPEKPAPAAVRLAGPVTVKINEWMVPTLGSRPHDPLAASDGSLWWSGMFANKLGRLDPRTGAMQEFELTAANSAPHGLVEQKGTGHIFFTAINGAYIGNLVPRTGQITQFPIARAGVAGARSPHTPIFDQQGNLWFTLQSGHVGRLNPATGEMKIVASPSKDAQGGSYPYGIQVNSQGVPWYVDFRGNRIASIDPVSMAITEVTLPNPASRPRRIALTPDDVIWYTDFALGTIGRYDPKTGQHKTWPSPGGRDSEPYGIASIGSTIWYSESGVRPNTLVHFDPQTEKFQTWTIPSGGGVVRNMMRTANNNLVMARSGVNRVALVEIGTPPANRTN